MPPNCLSPCVQDLILSVEVAWAYSSLSKNHRELLFVLGGLLDGWSKCVSDMTEYLYLSWLSRGKQGLNKARGALIERSHRTYTAKMAVVLSMVECRELLRGLEV